MPNGGCFSKGCGCVRENAANSARVCRVLTDATTKELRSVRRVLPVWARGAPGVREVREVLLHGEVGSGRVAIAEACVAGTQFPARQRFSGVRRVLPIPMPLPSGRGPA